MATVCQITGKCKVLIYSCLIIQELENTKKKKA